MIIDNGLGFQTMHYRGETAWHPVDQYATTENGINVHELVKQQVAQAIAAQRERDAVIAEGWLRVHGWEPTQDVGRMIAAAIRARGDDDT